MPKERLQKSKKKTKVMTKLIRYGKKYTLGKVSRKNIRTTEIYYINKQGGKG